LRLDAVCKNRHIEGMYRRHHEGERNQQVRNVSINKELKHAMTEVKRSSETSVHTRATRCHIPKDGVPQDTVSDERFSRAVTMKNGVF
jgi:hypothetical protein